MWNPKDSLDIQTSLDNLSSKFLELERMYQTSLRKSLLENQRLLSQQSSLSTELYHNLLKEQTKLENNQRNSAALKNSYDDELSYLKQILFRNNAEDSIDTEKVFKELKNITESSFISTRDKILHIPELDYFDKSIKERVQSYFQESLDHLDSVFLKFSSIRDLNVGHIGLKKIEVIASSNLLALNGIEDVVNQTKRRIIRSLAESDNCGSSYNKESQALEETFKQMKEEMSELMREARDYSLQNSYVGSYQVSPRGVLNTENKSLQKICDRLEQLLVQAVYYDSKKTQIFGSTKREVENLCGKLKPTIKDLAKHSEVLKSNHQVFEVIMKEKKKQNTAYQEEESPAKFSPYSTWASQKVTSPLFPQTSQGSEYTDFVETMGQKILHLKNTASNFVNSCEKMAAVVINESSDGTFAVKVFENERKILENYINSLSEFVKQAKTKAKDLNIMRSTSPGTYDMQEKFESVESPEIREKTNVWQNLVGSRSDSKFEKLKGIEALRQTGKFKDIESKAKLFEEDLVERGREEGDKKPRIKTAGHSAERLNGLSRNIKTDSNDLRNIMIPPKGKGDREGIEKEIEADSSAKTQDSKSKALLGNLLQKVKELTAENEKLQGDLKKLVKANKKIELKANDRKKMVKQLFELVTEKEKELNFLKSNFSLKAKDSSSIDAEEIEEAVGRKGDQIMEKYRLLQAQLASKEIESEKIKEILASPDKFKDTKGIGVNRSPRFPQGQDVELTGPNNEKIIVRSNLDNLLEQARELDKRKEEVEGALHNLPENISPSKVKELNSMLTSLKKEKVQHMIKIKELNSPVRRDKGNEILTREGLQAGGNDFEIDQRILIQELQEENRALEERCHELLSDIERLQDHKQKVEKNYQEEVNVLNEKVNQLNQYIQDLETKKNDRFRESLSPERLRGGLGINRDILSSPTFKDEKDLKEMNNKLKSEVKRLVSKVECLLDHFGIKKEEYSRLDSDGKIEMISDRVKNSRAFKRDDDSTINDNINTENDTEELKTLKAELDNQVSELKKQKTANDEITKRLNGALNDIENKQKEINVLMEKVSNTEINKDKLTAKITGLEKNIQLLSQENGELLSRIAEIEAKAKEQEKENERNLNILRKQIKEKEESLSANQNELAALKNKMQEKEKTIQEKEALIQAIKDSMHSSNEVTKTNEQHKLEVNDLNNRIRSLNQQIRSLTEEGERILIGKKMLDDQIKALRENKVALERNCMDLQEKLSLLQQQVQEKENLERDYLKKIARLEKSISEKDDKIERSKDTIEEIQITNNQLLEYQQQIQQQIEELKKANQDLVAEKESLLTEKMVLNSESSEAVESIKGKIKEYEKAIEREKDQGKKLEQEISQLRRDKETLSAALKKAENGCTDLKLKLAENEKEKENLQKEIRAKGEELVKLENKIKKKDEELLSKEDEMSLYRKDLEKSQQEFEKKLNNQKRTLEEVKTTLESKIGELRSKDEETERLRRDVQMTQENFGSEFKLRLEEIRLKEVELSTQKKTYEEFKVKLENDIKNKVEELLTKEAEVSLWRRKFETGQKEFEEKLNIQNSTFEDIKSKLENNTKNRVEELLAKEAEVSLWRRKFETGQKEFEDKLSVQKSTLEEIKSKLEHKIKNMVEEILEKDNLIVTLREKVDKAEQTLDEQAKDFGEKNTRLSNNLNNRFQEVMAKELELSLLRRKIEQKDGRLQDELSRQTLTFQESLKRFENDLEVKASEIAKKENELSALRIEINKIQNELKEEQKKVKETSEANETLVGEQQHKQILIQNLQKEVDQLTGSLKAKTSELEMARRSDSAEVESMRKEYNSQIQELNIQKETLKRRKEELKEEIKMIKLELENEKSLSQQVKNEKLEIEKELGNRKSHISDSKAKLAQLEKDLETLSSENLKVAGEKRELIGRIDMIQESAQRGQKEKENLQKEKEDLQKENIRLQGENEELRTSILLMREELVNMENVSDQERKTNEVITGMREELNSLLSSNTFKGISFNFRLENKEEVKKTINIIRATLESKDKENEKLVEELKLTGSSNEEIAQLKKQIAQNGGVLESKIAEIEAEFYKEKDELKVHLNNIIADTSQRFQSVTKEIKEILNMLPEEFVPNRQAYSGARELKEEELRHLCVPIKEFIVHANEIRQLFESQKSENPNKKVEFQNEIKIMQQSAKFGGPDKPEMIVKAESEPEYIKEADMGQKKFGTSFSVPDEIDDNKVRSFLEESVKLDGKNNESKREEKLISQEQEQIKQLLGQIRQLQDDYEKLETEHRQLKTNYEMLGFMNEDLKAELSDKEEDYKKLDEQLHIIKEEFSKLQMEKDRKGENPIAHEKQHIRTMFNKFMLSALQGQKDAEELLKLLLSLLELNEKEKTQVISEFKAKNTKKGVFAKLF